MQHNAHVMTWLRYLHAQWFINGDIIYLNIC